jgi:hypothetical protein
MSGIHSAVPARGRVAAGIAVLSLLAAPGALAQAPANDNRADAAAIVAFPATIAGSTSGATVERLDPQVSDCGRVDGTVWYKIDAAPDGRVVVSVQAAGLAPVIRAYRREPSAIREVGCGTALAGGRAAVSFAAVRGAGYLILVGRRPATPDAAFELRAELYLPPAHDGLAGGQSLQLPGTVRATTLGATSDANDPGGCDLGGATVWYRLNSPARRRVVLRLVPPEGADARFGVVEARRSRLSLTGCGQADDDGRGTLSYVPRVGSAYLVVVGQSAAQTGGFVLSGVVAQPAERTARALPSGGVASGVDYLTDVNDLWSARFHAGVVYKIGLQTANTHCPSLALRRGVRELLRIDCRGVRTFAPGPGGAGSYLLEVLAGGQAGRQAYRVRVAVAAADDLGVGRPLHNGRVSRGSLSLGSLDTVDLWHFDVARRSDVSLALRTRALSLTLLRENGVRLGNGRAVRRQLAEGRYVVAVQGQNGAYGLSLLVREITRTTVAPPAAVVPPGVVVALTPLVTPSLGGAVMLQIDRFHPLTGWHFHRLLRVATGSSVSWIPPAEGSWRIRARFLGTRSASPSRSGWIRVEVRAGA